jgi:hypothetical protein
MSKLKLLVLAFSMSTALASPVRASDPAGLAACQAGAQAELQHAIALCDQRGLGYSCQQDAESRYQAAFAECTRRYG